MSDPDPSLPVQSPAHRMFDDARLRLARLHVEPDESQHDAFIEGARIAANALRVERISFWLLINDRKAIRCHHIYHPSVGEVYEGAILQAADFPDYFRALESRRVISIDNALHDPVSREMRAGYLAPLGITSMLDVPVYRSGRVSGIVCHEHLGSPRHWTDEESDFAVSVAETIGRFCAESRRVEAESALDESQAQIARLQQFDLLGRMTAGIAHDFRSHLSAVVGFGELIAQDVSAPESAREKARLILEAGERAERLAQQLLTFGRQTQEAAQVLDVAAELARTRDVLRLAVRPGIDLQIVTAERLSRVMADRSLLERALLNLVLNAGDAMPSGGTIRIEAREERRSAGFDREVGFVAIEVTDQGAGMDEATRQSMFDPYFTTKREPGSGLGLLIVQQAMARCGGRIEVDSAPGKGTRVTLLLPRIGPEDRRPIASEAARIAEPGVTS